MHFLARVDPTTKGNGVKLNEAHNIGAFSCFRAGKGEKKIDRVEKTSLHSVSTKRKGPFYQLGEHFKLLTLLPQRVLLKSRAHTGHDLSVGKL